MTWKGIEQITLGSTASSITFNTGLSGYKFFRLTAFIVNDANVKAVYVTFNGDSGSNYSQQRVEAASTTVSGARSTGTTRLSLAGGTNLAANQFASFIALIAKPSASVKGQAVLQGGHNASPIVELLGGEWNDTSEVIDEIALSPSNNNFAAGTSVMLEGLSL